jgi:DUF4097 and DUF4098 domain-containing protein YvlB
MKTNKTIIALALLVLATGLAWSAQTVNERHPVARGAEIDIANIAGSLTIVEWDAAEVQIEGTLGDGVEGLDVRIDDNGVSIEVEYDEDYHGKQVTQTVLTIRVPSSSPVSVETISSSIDVSGVRGALDLESVSGRVSVKGMPEGLDIENVSGAISVESAPDKSDLASVSGSITVGAAMGSLDAENVSGSIVIEGGTLAGADIETVSGNITCKAIPGPAGDIDMETMSGSITLVIDAGAVASYDIETFSGVYLLSFFGSGPKSLEIVPENVSRS